MDEMTDFRQEEHDAIKAQISDDGLSGPPTVALGRYRADAQREKALTMAIHAFAEAEDYDADKIVEAAEKFAAFLAGLVTIKGDTNANHP
jgi:hypothetical protein